MVDNLAALRHGNWKFHFMIQEAIGLRVWERPYVPLRFQMLFNLRSDPYERADEAIHYGRWRIERAFALVPAQAFVGRFLATLKELPPRQSPGSFGLGQAMEALRRRSN